MNTTNQTDNKKELLALLAVIGGNVIFGFSFLFSKLALDIVDPIVLIAVRFTVAFIVLNIIVLVGKTLLKEKFSFSLKGKPKKQVLLLALCQPVIYFIAESYGIKLTSSSFAGVIIAMIPIAGIILDAIIMHSKITKKQIICAALSVLGVLMTTFGAKDMGSSVLGLIMLLVAVVAGALFYVFSKNSAAYYSPLERTYVMFAVGSLVFVTIALVSQGGNITTIVESIFVPTFWICIAYLAICSSVVAFLLLNFGSNHVSVSKATLMANSTTVISIVAGVIVLGENFQLGQVLGAVIIIVSVTLALLDNHNH